MITPHIKACFGSFQIIDEILKVERYSEKCKKDKSYTKKR
jgi:hypothetical protein